MFVIVQCAGDTIVFVTVRTMRSEPLISTWYQTWGKSFAKNNNVIKQTLLFIYVYVHACVKNISKFSFNFYTFPTGIFWHQLIYFSNVSRIYYEEYLSILESISCSDVVLLKFKDPVKPIMYLVAQAEPFLRHRADSRLWKISWYHL